MITDSASYYDPNGYGKAYKYYLDNNLCFSNDIGEPWELLGPTGNDVGAQMGHVSAVYVDPSNINNIVIGSNTAGIWKTTNKGVNWINTTDNLDFAALGIGNIVGKSSDPSYLLASTGISFKTFYGIGNGILYSIDMGSTWNVSTSLAVTNPYLSTNKVIFNPSNENIAYFITDEKLFKSTNSGVDWVEITMTSAPSGDFKDIECIASGRIFLSVDDETLDRTRVYYTDNEGVTWDYLEIDGMIKSFDIYDDYIHLWTQEWSTHDITTLPDGHPSSVYYLGTSSGTETLECQPSAPSTLYQVGRLENEEFNFSTGCIVNVDAYLPTKTKLKVSYKYRIDPSTFDETILYEYDNSSSTSDILLDGITSTATLEEFDYRSLVLRLETVSDFVYTDNFWIRNVVIRSAYKGVAKFERNKEIGNGLWINVESGHSDSRTVFATTDGINFTNFGFATGNNLVNGFTKMECSGSYAEPTKFYNEGFSVYEKYPFDQNTICEPSSGCHIDVRDMFVMRNPLNSSEDIIVVGHDGGVSLSENSGDSFVEINGDLGNSQVFSIDIGEGGTFC